MSQLEALLKLGLSEAEANQVLEDDKKIDKGKKMPFDLPKEKIQETRKYRQSDRTPTVYKFTQRERKPNNDKRAIIHLLADTLTDQEVEITNPERQIEFVWNGTKYRLVLSAPRK